MKASDIGDRFYQLVNDPKHVRATDGDLLRWITSGQLVMALVRPDTCAATVVHTLVAGTKQSLPADEFRLLHVHRCIDPTTGKTLAVLKLVDQWLLDSSGNWHAAQPSYMIQNVVYDNRDPQTYWVYPPAKNGAKVELKVTKAPAPVTAMTDDLSVNDLYSEPLLEYCLFRYYSHDTEYGSNPQLALGHLSAMSQMLGVKLTRDMALSPNLNTKGAAPTPGATVGGV